jgi:hypothetical protein
MSILNTALEKFFVHVVTIEPFTGEDDFNKPTYGTACEFRAKIERQQRILREDTMQTIRSRRLIYLYTTDTSITVKDRLTLPAGFEPLQPKITDVRVVSDHQGVHHIVLET